MSPKDHQKTVKTMQEKQNEDLDLPLKNANNLTVERPLESEGLSTPNSSGS